MIFRMGAAASVLAALALTSTLAAGESKPINIVVIGDSNTWGWGAQTAYPQRLQALLKARGYNAHVTNAGINGDTTNGMLSRIDAAAPEGTRLVIINPGTNDVRFGGTKEHRAANVQAMLKVLHTRRIPAIVFDPVTAAKHYQSDHVHITDDGHAKMAADLLPRVTGILNPHPVEQASATPVALSPTPALPSTSTTTGSH
jgi:acyl-CoA thioesterase-1